MKYCPNCGKSLDDNAQFCSECGSAVDDESTIQTTSTLMDKIKKHLNKKIIILIIVLIIIIASIPFLLEHSNTLIREDIQDKTDFKVPHGFESYKAISDSHITYTNNLLDNQRTIFTSVGELSIMNVTHVDAFPKNTSDQVFYKTDYGYTSIFEGKLTDIAVSTEYLDINHQYYKITFTSRCNSLISFNRIDVLDSYMNEFNEINNLTDAIVHI